MEKARIIVQYTRASAYVNVIAAIRQLCREVETVELCLVGSIIHDDYFRYKNIEEEVIAERNKCLSLEFYINTRGMGVVLRSFREITSELFDGCNLIDISCVDTNTAMDISMAGLRYKTPIYMLAWKGIPPSDYKLTQSNFLYQDVMAKTFAMKVVSVLRRRRTVIVILFLIFVLFVTLSGASLLGFDIIPEETQNILSLILGIGGIFLAIVTIERQD